MAGMCNEIINAREIGVSQGCCSVNTAAVIRHFIALFCIITKFCLIPRFMSASSGYSLRSSHENYSSIFIFSYRLVKFKGFKE